MAFAGEELGLLGSILLREPSVGPARHARVMINMDMIGRIRDKKVMVGRRACRAALRRILDTFGPKYRPRSGPRATRRYTARATTPRLRPSGFRRCFSFRDCTRTTIGQQIHGRRSKCAGTVRLVEADRGTGRDPGHTVRQTAVRYKCLQHLQPFHHRQHQSGTNAMITNTIPHEWGLRKRQMFQVHAIHAGDHQCRRSDRTEDSQYLHHLIRPIRNAAIDTAPWRH